MSYLPFIEGDSAVTDPTSGTW